MQELPIGLCQRACCSEKRVSATTAAGPFANRTCPMPRPHSAQDQLEENVCLVWSLGALSLWIRWIKQIYTSMSKPFELLFAAFAHLPCARHKNKTGEQRTNLALTHIRPRYRRCSCFSLLHVVKNDEDLQNR